MSSRIGFLTAGVVALGLLSGSSVAALRQDVTLIYRWTKGETLRYRIVQQNTTTISGLPGGMGDLAIDQAATQTIRLAAEDISADGTTTIRQVFESVKMEMNSPMFAMSYDSAKPDAGNDPMTAMLKRVMTPMIGESFTLVMAPTGEVQKVEGLTKLTEKMFQGLPQDPAVAGILDGIKANLSDDAMRGMFTQTFAQFPNKPLKTGDTWNTQISVANPMVGGLITSTTSTLKSVEGEGSNKVATIVDRVYDQAGLQQAAASKSHGPERADGQRRGRRGTGLRRRHGTIPPLHDARLDTHDDVGHQSGRHGSKHEDEHQDHDDRGDRPVNTDRIPADGTRISVLRPLP